jgi:hypothetical protein
MAPNGYIDGRRSGTVFSAVAVCVVAVSNVVVVVVVILRGRGWADGQ